MLAAVQGNGVRALVNHIDGISDDDIAELSILTGVLLVHELDDNFMPAGPGGFLDLDPAAAGTAAVVAQAKSSRKLLPQCC